MKKEVVEKKYKDIVGRMKIYKNVAVYCYTAELAICFTLILNAIFGIDKPVLPWASIIVPGAFFLGMGIIFDYLSTSEKIDFLLLSAVSPVDEVTKGKLLKLL